jgi:hypothetical protein
MEARVFVLEDLVVGCLLLNFGVVFASDTVLLDSEGKREFKVEGLSFSELGFAPELDECWLDEVWNPLWGLEAVPTPW